MKKKLLPVLSLVFANLVILLFAIIEKSSIFDLIIIYWLENVIIGFYNTFKMIKCNNLPDPTNEDFRERLKLKSEKALNKKQYILIFIGHYFAFCIGHLIFIISVFHTKNEAILINYKMLLVGAVTLMLSHGISFFINYVGKKEYLNYNFKQLMATPYGRVIFVHVFVMSTAWLINVYGINSWMILVVFIIGKILADLWRHLIEHRERPRIVV